MWEDVDFDNDMRGEGDSHNDMSGEDGDSDNDMSGEDGILTMT